MAIKRILGTVRREVYNSYDALRYKKWIKHEELLNKKTFNSKKAEWQPTISIVVPTYNTDIDFFDVMVKSVIDQTYKKWELILVDDKSPNENIRQRIKHYAYNDKRIKYIFLKKNHHIAGATNEGIRNAKGIFIGLLDHDDYLHPSALAEVIYALNQNKDLEFIYTDEDKLLNKKRIQPFFKPSTNIDLLHTVNYITHFSVIRKATLDKIGYERDLYNGAQDWELFLRVIRNIPKENIFHIPKILYSWRIHELSTSKNMGVKPYVLKAQEAAINDDLKARGESYETVFLNPKYPGQWIVKYKSPSLKASILYIEDITKITKKQQNSYDFVCITKKSVDLYNKLNIEVLISEASRKDIGIAVTGGDKVIKNNLNTILDNKYINLIWHFTHISVSKHIYRTTRYNLLEIIDYDFAVIATDKIKLIDDKSKSTVHELSKTLHAKGMKHMYIPYRDLL